MNYPPFAALDIGTSQTVLLVGETEDAKTINVIGCAVAPTTGVRKGQIIDIANAKMSVDKVLREVSEKSPIDVDVASVLISVSGADIRTFRRRSSVHVESRDGCVEQNDVDELREQVRLFNLPSDRRVLNTVFQNYLLDDCPGIRNPIGRKAMMVALDALAIHVDKKRFEDLENVVKSTDLKIEDSVFSTICSSLAVLTLEQKQSGVLLIDLGAGVTNYLVYVDGVIATAGSIALGGDHVTNDIASAFELRYHDAETLKLEQGRAMISADVGLKRVSLPAVIGVEPRNIALKSLITVINARLDETLGIIRDQLYSEGLLDKLGAGVVVTGGGAEMSGIDALANSVFGRPATIGVPRGVTGIEPRPSFSVAAGLLIYAMRTYRTTGFFRPFTDWLRNIFE